MTEREEMSTEIKNVIIAAKELIDYFAYHNKNTTKAQDEKLIALGNALLELKESVSE